MTQLSLRNQLSTPHEWSLSDLYKGFDDPKLQNDLQVLQEQAAEFRHNYRGQVDQLTPGEIARCLQQLEALWEKYGYLDAFANLVFYADTRNSEAKQFLGDMKTALTGIYNQLLFFNLELQDLDSAKFDELQASPALQKYSHYLNRLAQFGSHKLPREVGQARNLDSLTGRQAFLHLYLIHRGEQDYEPVTMPDGETAQTEAELEALLYHPDAEVRYDAYRSLRQVMQRNNGLYGFILNTIIRDHHTESQMRGYPSTFHKQLLEDEVPEGVFHGLVDVLDDRFDLFQRYYQLKGKAIGQKIRTCDLYAPWTAGDKSLPSVDYRTAMEIVLEALKEFNAIEASRASNFFSNNSVDAIVRAGKYAGAFYFPVYGKHPYLFLSYTNDYKSLFTLAQVIGQGLHYNKIRDRQTYFNSKPPMVLAEVSSMFSKLLLLDYLLEKAADDKHLSQLLLTQQLEEQLNLLFHQSTISRLELAIHERASQSSFDHQFVNEQWMEFYRELCGDAVEVLPEHQYDWAWISQIYTKPFAGYQYAAANIVSLVCYQKYREIGKDFIRDYLNLLSCGSSMNQMDAFRHYVGVDLEDPAMMNSGLDYIEKLLREVQSYFKEDANE